MPEVQSTGVSQEEEILYCSICSSGFDLTVEGDRGMIGMMPFAFCGTCKPGVLEWVELNYSDEDAGQ